MINGNVKNCKIPANKFIKNTVVFGFLYSKLVSLCQTVKAEIIVPKISKLENLSNVFDLKK